MVRLFNSYKLCFWQQWLLHAFVVWFSVTLYDMLNYLYRVTVWSNYILWPDGTPESAWQRFLGHSYYDQMWLDFAQVVGGQTKIIFTTAYSQFAINGFEVGATDYLLKPINFTRFLQACNRVMAQQSNQSVLAPINDGQNYIFLKSGYDWEKIDLTELLYIQADDNYLTFYTPHKKILTRMTLAEAMEKLPAKGFIKVHKSYIVAISKIEKIERHQLSINGKNIPLSANYRENLRPLLE